MAENCNFNFLVGKGLLKSFRVFDPTNFSGNSNIVVSEVFRNFKTSTKWANWSINAKNIDKKLQ